MFRWLNCRVSALWSLVRSQVVDITVCTAADPNKLKTAVQCFRGSIVEFQLCGRWFDLQWCRSRYALLMRPNKLKTAVQCFGGSIVEFQLCGRWFDLQWWRSRYALLLRPNKLKTAVQCFRISCRCVGRIFWSW